MLRDYQIKAHVMLADSFKRSERPLLVMPTGAGKTFTIIEFIKKVYVKYRCILVVRKRGLVDNLVKAAQGLDYAIYMAGHPENLNARLQICSIDTLTARKVFPFKDEKVLIIIDEADESNSPSYQDMINTYPHALIGGMTATPYNGLSHFSEVVMPISALELKRQGILVNFEYIVPEKRLDTSNTTISGGEFSAQEINAITNKREVAANAVGAWFAHSEQRPTLAFSSNVQASKNLCEEFNSYAGKTIAIHIDANSPDEVRAQAISDLEGGRIKILCNVGLIRRGTDIPILGCILDLAPTVRLNNHIQKLGRGSRKNDFFKDCIVIDMAANCLNLNHFYYGRKIDLKTPFKFSRKEFAQAMRVCKFCFRASENFPKGICPYCFTLNTEIKKAQEKKELELFKRSATYIEDRNAIAFFKKEVWKRLSLPHYKNKMYQRLAKNDRYRAICNEVHELMKKEFGREKLLRIADKIKLYKI